MGDNYEWELSKENVQPLKHGRNISSLMTALSNNEDQSKLHRHEQRRSLEQAIMAYSGPDPLEPWHRYIQWIEENYPQGGKEGDLLNVLEGCLEALKGSVQYKSDGRLLEVYLRYLDLTESDAEYFNQLFSAGFFHNLAVFYISWADAAETANDFKEGTRIYQLGMANKAEPANKLEEGYKHYQARVASAVFKSMNSIPPEKSEDDRNALGELASKSVLRSGALPVRQSQQLGSKLFLPGSSTKQSNRPIFICEDENGVPVPNSAVLNPKIAIPVHSVMKSENSLKAGRWTEAVVNENVAAVPSQPAFQVHVDEEVVVKPPGSAVKMGNPFSAILRDVKTTEKDPAKIFEKENPSVKLMCDLNRLLVGSREFSFEEIRRQLYAVNGRFTEQTPTTPKQVSSAALLNVGRSREKLKMRTPTEKSRTPKSVSLPVIGAPPPLKPTEKWGCDINALHRDGREWSFEQLRAMAMPPKIQIIYPSSPEDNGNTPSADENSKRNFPEREIQSDENSTPNLFKIPSLPTRIRDNEDRDFPNDENSTPNLFKVPSLPAGRPFQPTKENDERQIQADENATPTSFKKSTREIGIQTDLFGLDYDIVLVPRSKASTPEPPSRDPLTSGSEGSSPTVNTKQALSSVKSWFNSSNLLPAPAAPQRPLAPPSATKKSLFAIYKDPSILEPEVVKKPSSGFAIFADEVESEVVKKPSSGFAIFADKVEPEVEDKENGPVRPSKRQPLEVLAVKDEVVEDNFKENFPPSGKVEELPLKRKLSGILTPSTDIPCDPAGLMVEVEDQEAEAEAELFQHRQTTVNRALFAGEEDDQTRHYCVPVLSDEVDFTVPLSANAFARNLHIQSTPMQTGNRPLIPVCEDATFHLPSRKIQPTNPEEVKTIPASAPAATSRRGLSPIDEISREYFSSSGSSAGTTGLASRLSVGRSLHSVHSVHHAPASADTQVQSPVGRIYPAHFDPFELDHRHGQLGQLSVQLQDRPGFSAINGRAPWLRTHSSVHLGPNGDPYVVNKTVGQGAYAKIYEASSGRNGEKVVLKVQESDGPWEFYILTELERRLAAPSGGVLTVQKGYFYDGGSILVQPYLGNGTLLDFINHYKLKNSSMPESLVFHLSIQLLDTMSRLHEAGFLHADLKPDNLMLTPLDAELTSCFQERWTVDHVLNIPGTHLTLIDFGRSLDLTLYPERTVNFMYCFLKADKCPEMLEGKPWSYQLDYFGIAVTIFTMLMGVHCKISQSDGQWKVPNLKRGHNPIWKELTTALLNVPTGQQLDLVGYRRQLAAQLVSTIKPREYDERLRELDRYLAGK